MSALHVAKTSLSLYVPLYVPLCVCRQRDAHEQHAEMSALHVAARRRAAGDGHAEHKTSLSLYVPLYVSLYMWQGGSLLGMAMPNMPNVYFSFPGDEGTGTPASASSSRPKSRCLSSTLTLTPQPAFLLLLLLLLLLPSTRIPLHRSPSSPMCNTMQGLQGSP